MHIGAMYKVPRTILRKITWGGQYDRFNIAIHVASMANNIEQIEELL